MNSTERKRFNDIHQYYFNDWAEDSMTKLEVLRECAMWISHKVSRVHCFYLHSARVNETKILLGEIIPPIYLTELYDIIDYD